MDSFKLGLVLISSILSFSQALRLDHIQSEPIDGEPFTLRCSVNKTVNFTNVVWTRGDTGVLASTLYGFGVPLTNLHGAYGLIWGRHFVSLHGAYDHRLTLIVDPNKDQKSVWRCMVGNQQSNSITIMSRKPTPPSFWTVPWIYGLSTAITSALMILLIPLCVRGAK